MTKIFNKITIVGLGVIGGSFAKKLSALGYTVYGVDNNPKSVELALEGGFVADGGNNPCDFFGQSDLIVMALYPEQIAEYIHNNVGCFKPNTIIIDVAGLKWLFVDKILSVLPNNVEFVFCHPMAGREKKGFEYSDDKVFNGANFIITPTSSNTQLGIDKITNLAKQMGFGQVKYLSPKEHDNTIAYTSQLPHALAVALINCDEENSQTGSFIGDSFRDLTRIANINELLWSELFLNNKDNLLLAINKFEKELDKIKDCLINNDKKALEQDFIKATKRRLNLEKTKK